MNPTNEHDAIFDAETLITAYVLGELDEAETAAFERRLADDATLRRDVEAYRETTNMLAGALGAETGPSLSASQRAAVLEGPAPVLFTFRRAAIGVGLAAAACLVLAVAVPMALDRGVENVAMEQPVRAAPAETLESMAQSPTPMSGAAPGGATAVVDGDDAGLNRSRAMAAPRGAASTPRPGDAVRVELKDELQAKRDSFRRMERAGDAAASKQAVPPRLDPGPPPPPGRRRPPGTAAVPEASERSYGERFAGTRVVDEEDLQGVVGGAGGRIVEGEQRNREAYDHLVDNPFHRPQDEPLSTFSVDVDTASYSNMRRFLRNGQRPPKDAVRIEELINYFDYAYEPPSGADPFSVNLEVGACPWNPAHRLVRVGLKGQVIEQDMRPATNLVFLLDVSGSMNNRNKLPLVKESMRMLADNLLADDRVAIVVYAGASGLVLPPTYGHEKSEILGAIERLNAGGSTNGGAGIELAYKVAQESFIEGGVNRVILCTDGDFNVGVSSEGDLVRLIEEKRKSGVFLTVLGFGTGNFQDARMEKISNAGNGNFAYIDSQEEAHKVLVEEMSGTLVTIAKDVKVQVEFNPVKVGAYRLIGYANRLLAAEDFNDDTKDAGEIGAGHTVTALYEIAMPGDPAADTKVDPLKYQRPAQAGAGDAFELLTVKLRYKAPDGDVSKLIERSVVDDDRRLAMASPDFRFASAVAAFGMVLRDSEYKGDATFASVLDLATASHRDDPRRLEFCRLVEVAAGLTP